MPLLRREDSDRKRGFPQRQEPVSPKQKEKSPARKEASKPAAFYTAEEHKSETQVNRAKVKSEERQDRPQKPHNSY